VTDDADLAQLACVRTYSIRDRAHKVSTTQFATVREAPPGPRLVDLFPRILAGNTLRAVVDTFVAACRGERARLFALGGHVVKCGGGPFIIDLMRRGLVSGLAVNGAVAIHDLEIALIGSARIRSRTSAPSRSAPSRMSTGSSAM
jgi:hypothetical protein